MAGNVAEWTNNAYDESAFNFSHDMNMDFNFDAQDSDPQILKRKSFEADRGKTSLTIYR